MQLASIPFPSIHVANKVSVCMELGLRSPSAAAATHCVRAATVRPEKSLKRPLHLAIQSVQRMLLRRHFYLASVNCSSSLLAPEQIT